MRPHRSSSPRGSWSLPAFVASLGADRRTQARSTTEGRLGLSPRAIYGAAIACSALIALVAGLIITGIMTAQAAGDGYTYFPTASTTDGRMLRIAGETLSTLSGTTVTVSFSVPETATDVNIGFFDGRAGNGNAVNGQWDQSNTALETSFTLYADPGGMGDGTVKVAEWAGSAMSWNAWSDYSVPNTSTALAPSGRCFYYLRATAIDPTVAAGNCFKIRVYGTSYITPTKTFGYYASPNAPMTDDPTYDGTWEFYVRVPQGLTRFDMWDGDFDLVNDTDDPNTGSTPPTWSTAAALAEGVNLGAPPDDNNAVPAWRRTPNIAYDVILPDGTTYTNSDPSGNAEWELFRLDTETSSTTVTDYYVPAIPAGLWRIHMTGVDQHNLNALRFEQPVLGVDASGTPVEPHFPYAVSGSTWLDADRNGARGSGETSITGAIITLRDGAGSFIATTSVDAGGTYRFTTLPGTYTVDLGDPANWASGGPLAGLIATTPRTLSAVVTDQNVGGLDFGLATGPALVVDKSRAASSPATATIGEDTTYTVVVRNVGETTASSVVVTDTIVGADMEYVSGSTSASWSGGSSTADPAQPATSTLRWDFGGAASISSNATMTLTYRVRVRAGAAWGSHPDTVTVGATDASGTAVVPDASTWIAADTDPDDTDTASVWVTVPELRVTKVRTSSDATIQAGQTADFRIVVRNIGDSRIATVPLSDTFASANLAYSSANPAPDSVGAGSLSWTNVGPLDSGAQTTITVSLTAVAAPVGSVAPDRAATEPTTDVNGRPVPSASATATVAITRPHVSVSKVLSSSDATIQVGQSATFSLVVRNDGDTRIDALSLTDVYDSVHLAYTTSTPAPTPVRSTLTTFAVNASDTVNTWSNDESSLGLLFGDVATSGSPPFDMWHSFAFPPDMTAIDEATVTVRSRAYGGWGAANPSVPTTVTYVPTGDLQNGNWSIGGSTPAATRWQSIDDPPTSPDDDVTNVYPTGNTEYRASITAPSLPSGATNITVAVVMRIRDGGAQASNTWFRWRQGGTWRNGTGRDPGATYTTYVETLANPAGGAWTPAAVNQIDALGLDNDDRNPTPYVTQLYLRVTYDDPVPDNDDVWGIQYSTDSGASWSDITAESISTEAGLTDHALSLAGLLDTGNASGFRVRVRGRVVGSADNSGTAEWDYTKLELAYRAPPTVDGSLTWSDLPGLDPGQQTTVTVSFDASAAPVGHMAVDTATVDATTDVNGDPVASSTSAAAVAITRPSFALSKSLAPSQPATVGIGAPVEFDVVVLNTGDTTITAGSIVDTWSPTYLSYESAVPSPDSTGTGTATWSTMPSISPGRSATFTITYSAIATPPAGFAVNSVRASGVTDIYGDPVAEAFAEATVGIIDSRVAVSKTRVSADPVILVGQSVVYDIVVRNTGSSALATVPVTDVFEDAYLDWSSAVPPPDSTTSTSATWNDVTGAGTLAAGDQTTITVTLVATAPTSGRSTPDTATVSGAVDVNGIVSGPVSATASVIIRWSAEVTALSATDAPTLSTDVEVTSSVRNDLAIPIDDSVLTYVIWWDSDSGGTFNAGDIYIDSSGTPHNWDGVTAVSTHVTSGVDVAGGGTWSEATPWTVNNAQFPNQGTYQVTVTWTESNGTFIDDATTTFYSIPTMGWPLTLLAGLGGAAWLWRRRWRFGSGPLVRRGGAMSA